MTHIITASPDAAEAPGRLEEVHTQYEAAAALHPNAYYGQLARARLSLGEITLRLAPLEPVRGIAREVVCAAETLYAIGERNLLLSLG
jgi:soluble lytic murein transglycosylase